MNLRPLIYCFQRWRFNHLIFVLVNKRNTKWGCWVGPIPVFILKKVKIPANVYALCIWINHPIDHRSFAVANLNTCSDLASNLVRCCESTSLCARHQKTLKKFTPGFDPVKASNRVWLSSARVNEWLVMKTAVATASPRNSGGIPTSGCMVRAIRWLFDFFSLWHRSAGAISEQLVDGECRWDYRIPWFSMDMNSPPYQSRGLLMAETAASWQRIWISWNVVELVILSSKNMANYT